MSSYTLVHGLCSSCVWGENGHYNAICAHCPYCQYGKKAEPCWMSRGTALAINQICELTDDNMVLADELRKIKGENNGKET